MPSDDRESPPIPLPPTESAAEAPLSPEQLAQDQFFDALDAATPHYVVAPAIIAINVLVFAAMVYAGVGFLVPDTEKTIAWGVDHWPHTTGGQWWRLLTSAFVHFGVFHIAFNLWALYAVGRIAEQLYGNFVFLLIYLFCAVLSGLTSIWFEHHAVAAGASGAIFAIYGALLAYVVMQRAGLPRNIARNLRRSALGFVGLNIFMGFTVPGISNGAHIGGVVTGFVLGVVFARPIELVRRKRQAWPKLIAGVALGTAMVVAGIAFIPKVSPEEHSDLALYDTLRRLNPEERRVDTASNDILSKLENTNRLTDADLAIVQKDLIPTWTRIADELGKIQPTANSKDRPQYEFALDYAQVNRDLFQALVDVAAHPNQKHADEFGKLMNLRHQMRAMQEAAHQAEGQSD